MKTITVAAVWTTVVFALALCFATILPRHAPAQEVHQMNGLMCEASDEVAIFIKRTYDAAGDDAGVMDSLNADAEEPVCEIGSFAGIPISKGPIVQDGKGQSWQIWQVDLVASLTEAGVKEINPPAVRWTATLVTSDPA